MMFVIPGGDDRHSSGGGERRILRHQYLSLQAAQASCIIPTCMIIPSFLFTALLLAAMVALGWHFRASRMQPYPGS